MEQQIMKVKLRGYLLKCAVAVNVQVPATAGK